MNQCKSISESVINGFGGREHARLNFYDVSFYQLFSMKGTSHVLYFL